MGITLLMTTADGSSREFMLRDSCTTIGRRKSCDLHVPLPSIAPVHCEISIEEQRITLQNRDPEARTWHNGERVDEVELSDRDEVRIGPVQFTVSLGGDEVVIHRVDGPGS